MNTHPAPYGKAPYGYHPSTGRGPSIGVFWPLTAAFAAGCAGLLNSPAPTPPTSKPATQLTTPTTAPSAVPGVVSDPGMPRPTPTGGPPELTTMFVMNGLSKTLDTVNLKTGIVSKAVLKTGTFPNHLLVNNTSAYVVNSGDANILKLDLLSLKESGRLDVTTGANPMTLTLLGDGKGLVVNYLEKTVEFFDLARSQSEKKITLPSGQPGGGVAVANGKAYVCAVAATYASSPPYAATYSFSGIHVIDLGLRSLKTTINLPNDTNPQISVTKDPVGQIQVSSDKGVITIDPATDQAVRTIDFGKPIGAVAYLDSERAFAAADGNGLVSFNPKTGTILRSVGQKIVAGDTSVGHFAILKGLAYVPNFASDSVTVVDLEAGVATGSPYQVGDGPQEVGFVTTTP